MSALNYDVDAAIRQLDNLANHVPDAVPAAVQAMADVVVPAVRNAAPEDTGVLKKVIGKSGTRLSKKGNPYSLVFVKDRGLKDKNVFKAVVAEYGSDKQQKKPFWRDAVERAMPEAHEKAKEILEKAMQTQ
jgi:HK97 gp10 family phage protein